MTNEEKTNIFRHELAFIENESVRFIAMTGLEHAPNYFFEIPASSTGKYHPTYALGKGGLVRHTKAAVKFALMLKTIKTFDLSPLEYDFAIAAIILHDTCKNGIDDATKSDYTKFEHPLLAANKIIELFDFNEVFTDVDDQARELVSFTRTIGDAICTHMGQWNVSNKSSTVLPVPCTRLQKFVHTCDYLASRKELDVEGLAE